MSHNYDNLYNSLAYNLPSEDITEEEKNNIEDIIKILDQESIEIIYILILHDWNKFNPNTKVIFPYKTKQVNNNLEIKLDCLPIRLKRILLRFVTVAKSKLEETKNSK